MTLSTGTKLKHYEVVSQLGKGGMGEVYQAKDQKLGRDVAIKVLPEEFAEDSNRVARFHREAKLLASLNHPNIAAIYGLEESDGTHFLVLELIEGDTLADRLKHGAIPVEESLKLALQIAEALEAAHEKGVIHRDLKPANIKITSDGKVKVLDFGLAKAFAGEQGEMILSDSPTLSIAATEKGVILGTAAYMSPEQARGETVDKKADIWAFGVVLFEMLTGRWMFEGRSVSDVLASVLKSEPEWNSLPPNLHPRIRLLLERCLEKESKNRYHDIADARVDVQKVLADPSGVFAQTATATKPRKKLRVGLPWLAAAIVFSLIVAGVAVWKFKPTEQRNVVRLYHDLPANQQFSELAYPVLAVSPEGNQFAYTTNEGLYMRSIDGLEARLIAGTEESLAFPSFSPDGQWIAYWSRDDGQLKKVAISGGTAAPLCPADLVYGVFWNIDDTIIYSQQGIGVLRVSANGGDPQILIKSENETIFVPRLLPDGDSIIFSISADGTNKIAVQSLKSGERNVLFPGTVAYYLPIGYIAYTVDNNLYAAPFDLKTLKKGGGIPLEEPVLRAGGASQFAVSDSGTLAYLPEQSTPALSGRTLVWVNREGIETPLTAPPDAYSQPQISPNGKQIAFMIASGGNPDIKIWDLDREGFTQLTTDPSMDIFPLWNPDGQRILFTSSRSGNFEILSMETDRPGDYESVYAPPGQWIFPISWSKDGTTLICMSGNQSNFDITALSMEGKKELKPLLNQKYNEILGKISPDGKWMAFNSDMEGQFEVYLAPYPEAGKHQSKVSTNGGVYPLWSPDGDELYYRNGDVVLAVDIKTEPEFEPAKPKILFQGSYALLPNYSAWDISPDGKWFLMMKESRGDATTEEVSQPKINIVLNWFEELKDRVPAN